MFHKFFRDFVVLDTRFTRSVFVLPHVLHAAFSKRYTDDKFLKIDSWRIPRASRIWRQEKVVCHKLQLATYCEVWVKWKLQSWTILRFSRPHCEPRGKTHAAGLTSWAFVSTNSSKCTCYATAIRSCWQDSILANRHIFFCLFGSQCLNWTIKGVVAWRSMLFNVSRWQLLKKVVGNIARIRTLSMIRSQGY